MNNINKLELLGYNDGYERGLSLENEYSFKLNQLLVLPEIEKNKNLDMLINEYTFKLKHLLREVEASNYAEYFDHYLEGFASAFRDHKEFRIYEMVGKKDPEEENKIR